MSLFWSIWIFGLTAITLVLVLWVLLANRKVAVKDDGEDENRTTGHVHDGIEEYDNPLPKWWFQLFLGTIVFAVLYLIWFPGVWAGVGGWTQEKELAATQQAALEAHAKSYGVFSTMPVEELVDNHAAMKMATRIFSNNCAVCHGSDGGGNYGIPNLTDTEWLYGGDPATIRHTLINGRAGNMPAWGSILSEDAIAQTAEYVLSLSGGEHNADQAAAGAAVFAQNCGACHGANGKGLAALGAPNLTDDIWLYSGEREAIVQAIRKGFANQMPAQQELLREEKIHLLTAYVMYLSGQGSDEE